MDSRDKVVYVIDDDRMDRKFAERIISRSEVFDKFELFDGPLAAMQFISDGGRPPELILLDINMPPISGFEFLERYASQIQALDPVPVVVIVSATVNPADLDRAAKFPLIKKFLCKPLSPEQLAEAASLLH